MQTTCPFVEPRPDYIVQVSMHMFDSSNVGAWEAWARNPGQFHSFCGMRSLTSALPNQP